ncbi:MAG: hypothetical protein IJ656_01740 [Bacilli bacterium]|nr:hypothetical protein [Bacilli bacterium]
MTKKEQQFELIQRSSPAKPLARFLSYLLEFVMLFVVSYALFYGSFRISVNSNKYKENEQIVKVETDYYNELISKTHLVYFLEDGEGNKDRYLDNGPFCFYNISRLLLFSNSHDLSGVGWYDEMRLTEQGKSFNADIVEEFRSIAKEKGYKEEQITKESSYVNDDIAYFYTEYVKNNNEDNDILDPRSHTYEEYYLNELDSKIDYFGYNSYFAKSSDESLFPYVIEKSVAKTIFKSYKNIGTNVINSDEYDSLVNLYNKLQEEAEELVLKSKKYYSEHYTKYISSYNSLGKTLDFDIFIGFVIGFILLTVIPLVIFNNGINFSRKIIRLAVIRNDQEKPRIYQTILRCLFEGIFLFPITFLFTLLPPFNANSAPFGITLFSIGSLNINLIIIYIFIAVLGVINFVPCLFTHFKTTLVDIILKTGVRDLKHIDEYDFDEKAEGAL